jgi:hypothetical protein
MRNFYHTLKTAGALAATLVLCCYFQASGQSRPGGGTSGAGGNFNLTNYVSTVYGQLSTNWDGWSDSWFIVNGNTGNADTSIPWTYQAAKRLGFNYVNHAVTGLGLVGNIPILWTNGTGSNRVNLYGLVQNDAGGAFGNTAWQEADLAQLMKLECWSNDPALQTGVQMAANTNITFSGGWTNTPNTYLQGWGCTTNGATNIWTTNAVFGRSVGFCVDGFTNATGANFYVYVDGQAYGPYSANISSYITGTSYNSNSIPIGFAITGLSDQTHTLMFSNAATGSASNLNINYVFTPDTRTNFPFVFSVDGAPDPPNGNGAVATAALNGFRHTNVVTLNAMGLGAACFPSGHYIPNGPHGTASPPHPTPQEYTNIANGFYEWAVLQPPNTLSYPSAEGFGLSQGYLALPLQLPGLGSLTTANSGAGQYNKIVLTNFPAYMGDSTGGGQIEWDGSSEMKVTGSTYLYLLSAGGAIELGAFVTNTFPLQKVENFYPTINIGWTNTYGRQVDFRIPFSYSTTSGNGWGVQVYISNYTGTVGASGTVTNVEAFGLGAAGLTALTQAGSNVVSGTLGPNSSILVVSNLGAITLLTATNNQSSLTLK